eukprot:409673-Rhodomonas_salina.1
MKSIRHEETQTDTETHQPTACYAMSGTELAYGAIRTYGASSRKCSTSLGSYRPYKPCPRVMVVPTPYAKPGTGLAYGCTRYPVLTWLEASGTGQTRIQLSLSRSAMSGTDPTCTDLAPYYALSCYAMSGADDTLCCYSSPRSPRSPSPLGRMSLDP